MNGAQPHGYESTFGEVSGYAASAGAGQLYSESYVRDNLGRITQRTEVLQGTTTVWGYGYDTAGRLASVTRNGAAFESYTFDSNDNRLTKTTAAGTTTYAHDDQDRLLSAVGPDGAESWIYDGHGDLLSHNGSAGQTSFDYETGGQLLSLIKPNGDVVSYDLDAGNKRAVKRVNGVVQRQWVYAGGLLPVAELDGSGNQVAVFNGGFMTRNGTTYRLLRDHLGSVRMVVDTSTGTVVQRLSYGPFGEILEDTNPGFQPFGFAGGLYDPDTGLVRFGARDYSPSIGRWTCKDPIGLKAGSNVYAYCGNDPQNCLDPKGLDAYLWIREQSGPLDTGHVWIEVDDPDTGGVFSIGAYGGIGLQSPDPGYNERQSGDKQFHLAKRYTLCDDEERRLIAFLKERLKDSQANPNKYYDIQFKPGTREVDPDKTAVCTTVACRFLKKTFDPSLPTNLLQPNNLYNLLNPGNKIPAGMMNPGAIIVPP